MNTIIDRRSTGTRSAANQERLRKRVRSRLRDAVEKMAHSGSIEDLSKGQHSISVPTRDLHESSFHPDAQSNSWDRVFPGNKEYASGDTIEKPDGQGSDGGREGSPDGLGPDEIGVVLSADEFLSILFDGLELPHLRNTANGDIQAEQWKRAGFIRDGSPSRMNVGRTMRTAKARRMALRAGKYRELHALEKQIALLQAEMSDLTVDSQRKKDIADKLAVLNDELTVIQKKIKAVPFIDESDLRFTHIDQQPVPITSAVMFCVMDVSGSMGDIERDLAKRFFMLLYLFINRQYKDVQVVFIKHHSTATECTESEFFGAREGGGTLVSPAIQAVQRIIDQRFPVEKWNIYVAQASDGDNYYADNAVLEEYINQLLPVIRSFFYLEVNRHSPSDIMKLYRTIATDYPEMVPSRANERADVYPLFRSLFSRKG